MDGASAVRASLHENPHLHDDVGATGPVCRTEDDDTSEEGRGWHRRPAPAPSPGGDRGDGLLKRRGGVPGGGGAHQGRGPVQHDAQVSERFAAARCGYRCHECGAAGFDARRALFSHLWTHLRDDVDVDEDDGHKPVRREEERERRGEKLGSRSDSVVRTDEKPRECASRPGRTSSSLRPHKRRRAEEKSYECNQCWKRFARKDRLTAHMAVHTGVWPYECNQCRKGFTQKAHLASHMVVHTGERAFECVECGKTFTDHTGLRRHKRLHTGERPYECNQCRKRFSQKAHLASHMIVHTREKSFECVDCGKKFGHKCGLAAHRVVHTGEKRYECEHCGKKFSFKSKLRSHVRVHTGEKP